MLNAMQKQTLKPISLCYCTTVHILG